jgi:hypothetical protein
VHRYLPLARSVARRYVGRGEPQDDLVQVASIALLRAIDRFGVERGTAFASFAVPTIAIEQTATSEELQGDGDSRVGRLPAGKPHESYDQMWRCLLARLRAVLAAR